MSDTDHTTDGAAPTADEDRALSLELDGITKEYTEDDGSTVVAVDDVSLDVYEGEFIVLVGPSGCGKTTTLRIVAGLEQPTRGSLRIGGEDVAGREPRERDIAMVFQNYALYPHKTVRGNIAFPLKIRKYPDDEIETRVQDTADLLGIGELLDRHPADLSGGQQQRVALGRAIVRDPAVFLFDEPLSNLDAKLRIQMRTELNKLHDRVGRTSVYVTHDQVEAMTLSDRVVVMNDGTVQQVARPKTVYQQPANRFVAGFIGEPPMNFFPVTTSPEGDRLRVDADGFSLVLPPEITDTVAAWDGDTDRLELGIRPEAFEDAALVERSLAAGETFPAYVAVVEPMGPNTDLALRPDNRADDEAAEFTARVANETDAAAGETIEIAVDTTEIHLFDPETGENILA
ncbi:ABC transporter ATP-binding protein [Halolamina rubra]|uniref:ABC transporter ATP-binding protein n=1 Tax=Halolamina rubra TaxID=1380430 RepID=UPI0009E5EFDA|nr:sn-glycerol-3-phosphate ABC transporter ATP-binding protein UgpC [Halolamina rubra]